MIKAVFFDVDGTLFSHRSLRIPASSLAACQKLRANDIKIFTATGRHILELKRMLHGEIAFDGYVTLNGQLDLDQKQRIIYGAPFPKDDAQILRREFKKKNLPLTIVEADRIFANYNNKDTKKALAAIHSPLPEIGQANPQAKIYQGMVYGQNEETAALIKKLPHCRYDQWNPVGFDIIPQDGSKMRGIEAMLKAFGLKAAEAMAIGDGNNDLQMLQDVGIGVAMGNGTEKIKKAADYVTDDIDKSGVYHALRRFQLI